MGAPWLLRGLIGSVAEGADPANPADPAELPDPAAILPQADPAILPQADHDGNR
jgi:hypothetical protein